MAQTKNINPSKTEIQKPFSLNNDTKSNFEQQKKSQLSKNEQQISKNQFKTNKKFLKNKYWKGGLR